MKISPGSFGSLLAGVLLVLRAAVVSAGATPLSLAIPQPEAFAILGHSCGGIQEQAFVTGFDASTGNPAGAVYLQTRCGGSGKGGGYHVHTYSTWLKVTWDFAGNLATTETLPAAPPILPAFSETDAYGDRIYNLNNAAFLEVPTPGAPAITRAFQSGDQAEVYWKTAGVNPAAVTSSTLTARPASAGGAVVRKAVTGPALHGFVGPLQPQTAYEITVLSRTVGGAGPESAPAAVTTKKATIPPSAPTGLKAVWTANATLAATWRASTPGDSPVDQYRVTISGSDGGGVSKQVVSGTTLGANFSVDTGPDWTVTVAAHNAAGWSGNSTGFTLGGL